MNYTINYNEKEIIASVEGVIDNEEIYEVAKLPISFSKEDVIEELSKNVWWLTEEELKDEF